MMALGAICARHGVGLAPHGVGSSVSVAAALHVCRAAPGFRIYEANRGVIKDPDLIYPGQELRIPEA